MLSRLPQPSRLILASIVAALAFARPDTSFAQSEPEPTSADELVVGVANVWNLQGEARTRPQRFQIDAIVHHYDPVWRQLWAQDGNATFFMVPPATPPRLPIRAGQLVRLTGVTTPERFNSPERLSAEILDESPQVIPIPAAGRLSTPQALNEKWVEVVGFVHDQTLYDPNHLRLAFESEGAQLDAILWLETGSPVPRLAGTQARIRGVFSRQIDPKTAKSITYLLCPSPASISISEETAALPPPEPVSLDAPPAAEAPLVGFAKFWDLRGAEHARPRRFQIDAIVHYYDPIWRLLWAQEGDATFFIIPPADLLPIRSGQRIRLTGTTSAANFARVSTLSATVLDESPSVAPEPAAGRLRDSARLEERFVEIAGYVERQRLADANHLSCVLISEGLRIDAVVWIEAGTPVPSLTGAHVRAQGVYRGQSTPDGQLQSIALFVPNTAHIEVTGQLRHDPRFETPVSSIEQLPGLATDAPIHVAGKIVATVPGRSITIRDRTGQLELLTPQEADLALDSDVEAIGYPSIARGIWQLRQALVRRARPRTWNPSTADRATLRLASQVLALPTEKAEAHQPVLLQGVVTWSSPDSKTLYIQDPSGGIRVDWTDSAIAPPEVGTGLSVEGASDMGAFAPTVAATRLSSRYGMTSPEPLPLSLPEAESGTHEARWVEMRGLLHDIRPGTRSTQLTVTTPTGDFEAQVPSAPHLAAMEGAFVGIRGVCTAIANEQRQLLSILLRVPHADLVTLEESPPADLFALPENTITSLRQFGHASSATHWVRTIGVVTYRAPGRNLIIQDGSDALAVIPSAETQVQIGDRIEVVGTLGLEGPRRVLRNAEVRSLGRTPLGIQPVQLSLPARIDDELDNRLVRFTGELDEVTELGDERFLEIRHAAGTLIARWIAPSGTPIPSPWRSGSEIEFTGICHLLFDEHRRSTGFELLLRSPADLRILRPAPWWTSHRIRNFAAVLTLCLAGGVLWVVLLRRKVGQQTAQLKAQLEKEAHLEAELERAQRLQALGTLAGGIAHDFNNLLTVIMGNITLAMLDEKVMARVGDSLKEAEAGTHRARELTQQMLTFARGGDPIHEDFEILALLHETVALALSGARVRTEIHPQPGLHRVHADRAQIHRALLNLLAHSNLAMPDGGIIAIELAEALVATGDATPLAPGRYVRIRISDRGNAIPASRLPSIFDPYAAALEGGDRFGLATAYSIARKHGGHLAVESDQGVGTAFTLWLPAAESASATAASVPARDADPAALAGSRVLFMDDEESIRLLGTALLQQLQCDPVTVADGAACIAAYRDALTEGRPFDIVVMDLTIPGGMGGKETIVELRKIDPLVCAVVSSGYADDPVLARYREHGFAAAVPKPYEVERLAAALARALAEQRDR